MNSAARCFSYFYATCTPTQLSRYSLPSISISYLRFFIARDPTRNGSLFLCVLYFFFLLHLARAHHTFPPQLRARLLSRTRSSSTSYREARIRRSSRSRSSRVRHDRRSENKGVELTSRPREERGGDRNYEVISISLMQRIHAAR